MAETNEKAEIYAYINDCIAKVFDQVVKNWNKYYDEKTAMNERITALEKKLAEIEGYPVSDAVLSEG